MPEPAIMAAKQPDLIYDVGMSLAEDTAFYLKKGFRVVAFEAEPSLVQAARRRFAEHITVGRLTIVEGAIADKPAGSSVCFYRCPANSVWGTIDKSWAETRINLGAAYERLEVPAVSFADSLLTFGVPYYLKIDIEGADMICLRQMAGLATFPDYVSIEADKTSWEGVLAEVRALVSFGYRDFQAVQQVGVQRLRPPFPAREGNYVPHSFPPGASGLFGRELPERWKDEEGILREYHQILRLHRWFGDKTVFRRTKPGGQFLRALSILVRQPVPGWHDTHARHSSAAPT